MLIVPLVTLGIFIFLGISGHRYISLQHSLLLDISVKMEDVERILADNGELRLIHANLYKILSWYNTGYDENRINELVVSQDKKLAELIKRINESSIAQKQELVKHLEDYGNNMKNAIDMASTDLTLATTFVTPCEKDILLIDTALSKILSEKKDQNALALENATMTYRRIAVTGVAAIGLSIVMIAFSGYVISQIIRKSITKTISNVEKIARGDLTEKIGTTSDDELGRIAKAVDSMRTTLGSLVVELHTGAETVVGESEKLSNISSILVDGVGILNSKSISVENSVSATMDWISGIESSATGVNTVIEKLHDSVNEINTTITAIAGNSQRVFVLTSEDATKKIQISTGIINDLNESIQKINKITEIIKTVSDQTNLLALNATIEAVRAGQYGKGFGVVAEEVKNLARQTSVSASEISLQINAILAKSTEAVNSVSELSDFMRTISEITLNVSSTIEEQKHALNDISSSIASTSLSSREIAGNVANSLKRLGQIKNDVGVIFKTSDTTSDAAGQIKEAVARFGVVTTKLKSNIDLFKI